MPKLRSSIRACFLTFFNSRVFKKTVRAMSYDHVTSMTCVTDPLPAIRENCSIFVFFAVFLETVICQDQVTLVWCTGSPAAEVPIV